MPEPAIRVLIVDDHPLVRDGLSAVIAAAGMEVVAEAGSGDEAIALFRLHLPDVTLMDLRLPGLDGVLAIRRICADYPHACIIALTSFAGDEDIHRALDAGARGYLLKDMLRTEVVNAIRAAPQGGRLIPPAVAAKLAQFMPRHNLSPREMQVLKCLARGLRNKEIGFELGTTEGTIKVHVKNILDKLTANDRTHAVTIALQRGIIQLPT